MHVNDLVDDSLNCDDDRDECVRTVLLAGVGDDSSICGIDRAIRFQPVCVAGVGDDSGHVPVGQMRVRQLPEGADRGGLMEY